jgi:hypothetical protein
MRETKNRNTRTEWAQMQKRGEKILRSTAIPHWEHERNRERVPAVLLAWPCCKSEVAILAHGLLS